MSSFGRGDLVRGKGGPYADTWKVNPAKLTPEEQLKNARAHVEKTARFVIAAQEYLEKLKNKDSRYNDPNFVDPDSYNTEDVI